MRRSLNKLIAALVLDVADVRSAVDEIVSELSPSGA
jgi:hypothetical protein